MSVMLKVKVKESLLADILCIALEGGIGYWSTAEVYFYSETDPADTHAIIHEHENDGSMRVETMRITTNTIYAGICILLVDDTVCNDSIRRRIMMSLIDEDYATDIDADDADCIVQLGLFGRIVYG